MTPIGQLTAWILGAMNALQPVAPWVDTYEETAEAFARSAVETPIFRGEKGPQRTASVYVSVAWFESRFDPHAIGDGGTSVCAFQINRSNFKALGVTRDELLGDIDTCVGAANRMLRWSFRACSNRPLTERLGWYAAGGRGCDRGLKESRHRMNKATWLFQRWNNAVE